MNTVYKWTQYWKYLCSSKMDCLVMKIAKQGLRWMTSTYLELWHHNYFSKAWKESWRILDPSWPATLHGFCVIFSFSWGFCAIFTKFSTSINRWGLLFILLEKFGQTLAIFLQENPKLGREERGSKNKNFQGGFA